MRRLTLDEVRKRIESEGYKLISKEYVNSQSPIIVACPHGHPPYSVTFSSFNDAGSRCPYCAQEKKKESRSRWTDQRIREFVESQGYILNSIFMGKDNRRHIDITCPNHHTYSVNFYTFIRGSRCGVCAKKGIKIYSHRQIAEYYLKHSRTNTASHFNISRNTVSNMFTEVYGCSKRDYLKKSKRD